MHYLIAILVMTLSFFQAHAEETLSVGIATMDVTPAMSEKINLGGFGSGKRRNLPYCLWRIKSCLVDFKPAKGVLDPIRAKAMYLSRGDKKLLFISLDLVGVNHDLYSDLVKRLASEGFDPSEVIISATHTHSGPGALAYDNTFEVIAMGEFRKDFYEKFGTQVLETVKTAKSKATAADLYTLSFDTEGLQRNRRGAGRALDHKANLLVAQAKSGQWLGGMINYAIHGTAHGASNLFFSSDVPGAIEANMETWMTSLNSYVFEDKAEFVFMNGAEGDVAPDLSNQTYRELGVEFAKQASESWAARKPMTDGWKVKQQEIYVGSPSFNLKMCLNKRFPRKWKLGMKRYMSTKALINQVHFGDLWFLTWPGEPTTELGFNLVNAAKESGAGEAWVLGLANGYLSYFTSAEDYKLGGYEACNSFYRGAGADNIINAHKKLSENM